MQILGEKEDVHTGLSKRNGAKLRESFCPAAASHSRPRQAGPQQNSPFFLHNSVHDIGHGTRQTHKSSLSASYLSLTQYLGVVFLLHKLTPLSTESEKDKTRREMTNVYVLHANIAQPTIILSIQFERPAPNRQQFVIKFKKMFHSPILSDEMVHCERSSYSSSALTKAMKGWGVPLSCCILPKFVGKQLQCKISNICPAREAHHCVVIDKKFGGVETTKQQ